MAIVFKHRYKSGSLIGTGAVKFRPYTVASPLPQLATPQNVTADGTTVSWDAVENATSYAVLADGSEIGTGEQLATPQNVTADRATVSWNAVENATWYEILVGSSDFGAVYTTSVNLRELPGWESLTDGEYSVTIVAKADGYIDSDPSAVSVEKVTEVFVQIFPTATSDNYTQIENLNQSKIYSIKFANSSHVDTYIIYGNDGWRIWSNNGGHLQDMTDYKLVSRTNNSIVLVFEMGSGFARYLSGITLEGDTKAINSDFEGFSPTAVYAIWECFVEGTKITLSDGSTKLVQDIQYDDELLVWDFDNACLTSAKPLWIMKVHKATKYNHLVFSDGSTLDTVNQHRIFNLEKGMFTYPMTDDTPTGTTTFNDKGEYITLVSKEVIEGEVNYYNIITDYHMNLFAGTILTSCRLSNLYPIKDMRYVRDGRNIVPYEEFNNIPIEYYYGLRLGEQPTDINRDGAVSFGDTSVEDYVRRLINIRKE